MTDSEDFFAVIKRQMTQADDDFSLRRLVPYTSQALINDGPDLIDVFVSGTALIRRVETHSVSETSWLPQLKQLAECAESVE